MSSAERTVRRGDARDAATIAVAVGVVGVSFGALAPSAGLSPVMTMAMSTLVFAGGAQLAVTGILAAGGGIVAAVAAGLVLNLRHLSFGLALAPTLGRGPSRFAGAHVVTDESTAFVLARGSGTDRARRAFWTLGVLKYTCWQAGTALGLLLGTIAGDPSAFGVDAAFPAAMLAMLLPMLRAADAKRVGAGAAAISLAVSPFAPVGVPVLAGLLGVGLAGRTGSGRHGGPGSGTAPDPAGSGVAGPGVAGSRSGGPGPGPGRTSAGSAAAGPDLAGSDSGGSDLAGSGLAGSDSGGSDLAGSGLAGSDSGGSDLAGPDLAGPDLAGPDSGGPGSAGPDPGGPRSGAGRDSSGRGIVRPGREPHPGDRRRTARVAGAVATVLASWDRVHARMFAMPGRPS